MPQRSNLQIEAEEVKDLAQRYEAKDDNLYYANLKRGRNGDPDALYKLTTWKNASKSGKPMDFMKHKSKMKAWKDFRRGLSRYLSPEGRCELRNDFKSRARVWSIFWHHILYDTPIFDVNTNIAYHHFSKGQDLERKRARVSSGNHWKLYDEYCRWFESELKRLHSFDGSINARTLDRALFIWGREH